MKTKTKNNNKTKLTLNNAKTLHRAGPTPPRKSAPRPARSQDAVSSSPFVKNRVGKIARLPASIRDELNDRLYCELPGPDILEWLNSLPETLEVLRDQFYGQPITKQNLSQWRRGGFAEWVIREDLKEQVSALDCHGGDLDDAAGKFFADDLLLVLTARYAALLARWDGRATRQMDAQVKLLSRMRRDLVGLQRSAYWGVEQYEKWEQQEDAKEKAFETDCRNAALRPLFMELNENLTTEGCKNSKFIGQLLNHVRYGAPLPDNDPKPKTQKSKTSGSSSSPTSPPPAKPVATTNPVKPSQTTPNSAQTSSPQSPTTNPPPVESKPVAPLFNDESKTQTAPAAQTPSPQPPTGESNHPINPT